MWQKLLGTVNSYLRIGGAGPRLVASGANLVVKNSAGTANAEVTADKVNVSGTDIVLNSDADGTTDFSLTLAQNEVATESLRVVFPPGKGTDGQVLAQKASTGSGVVEFEWVSSASTESCIKADKTSLAYNSSSPVTAFTLPANAVINEVKVVVSTAFDGSGPSPSVTLGVSGNTAKYLAASESLLGETGTYVVNPNLAANGSAENLILTFVAGGSATAGDAIVTVEYSIPS